MDGDRRGLLVSLAVGLLLMSSGVLPQPVFASPYQTSEPAPYLHQAVPADDSDFERYVELYEFDPSTATPVDELSPVGQQAVERTIAESPDDDGWHRYELPVCRDEMLVCDSVREPPGDFQYSEGPPEQVFTIIEADGERYLLQTGVQSDAGLTDGLGDQPTSTYVWLFGLLPFGVIVVASRAIGHQMGQRRLPAALTAVGGGLLVAGLAVPYLHLTGFISYPELSGVFVVAIGSLTLLAVGALVWQTVQYTGAIDS